jgi:hypothetical protein
MGEANRRRARVGRSAAIAAGGDARHAARAQAIQAVRDQWRESGGIAAKNARRLVGNPRALAVQRSLLIALGADEHFVPKSS